LKDDARGVPMGDNITTGSDSRGKNKGGLEHERFRLLVERHG